MWDFFKRRRLVGKGLDCGKRRRSVEEGWLADELHGGWLARWVLLAGFAIGLAAMIFSGHQDEPAKRFLLGLLVFGTAVAQLWMNHGQTFRSNSRLGLVLGVIMAQLVAIKILIFQASCGNMNLHLALLLMPYAFAPLILSVLIGRNHGIFAAFFGSIWGLMVVGKNGPAGPVEPTVFLVISLITGFIGVFVTMQVRRRSRLIRAGVYVGIATWILAAAFGLIGPIIWESLGHTDWRMVGFQSLAAIGTGIVTAIVVSGVLPLLENGFKITTDISWLERSDLNHPLLKRMSMEAPGTYHHSLAVANLAEAAAETVGANPTICRVCSYFHDIGKLVKPDYFTENIPHGENPHDELTPTMSALIIVAHVKEGVDLALKHKLNPEIVDAIQRHHGTSLVTYFYKRALQQQEDARMGGKIMNMREDDIPAVKEESFRYPGSKPNTKETAIISLADAIESASRSLDRPTPQRIEDLVREIVESRIAEHQLDEAPLTLQEIRRIADSFVFTLVNMMHARIAYPKHQGSPEEKREEKSVA